MRSNPGTMAVLNLTPCRSAPMSWSLLTILRQLPQDLDRLLAPEAIFALCRRLGHRFRRRALDPAATLYLLILQTLHANTALSHLPHLAGLRVTASAICQARMRLPLAVFQGLLRAVTEHLQDRTTGAATWRGHRLVLIDGSSYAMPDTPALRRHFGQPTGQRPGCGFPVAHLMAVFDATTGLLLEALSTPLRTHDMSQVAALHPRLRPGDVLVGDRGFCSFAHLALAVGREVQAVFRIHQRQIVDFTPGRPHAHPRDRRAPAGLPKSRWLRAYGLADQVVEWLKPAERPRWLSAAQDARLPASLVVRELRYRVEIAGFRTREVTLVTSLIDAATYPAAALAEVYGWRWQVEVNLRHLKQTMKMDVLKCETVDGVSKELAVYALVYNLVRVVMLEASRRQGVAVDRISFVDALRWLSTARPGEPLPRLKVNPARPHRVEPRVVKRRPKPYPRMTAPRAELRNRLLDNEVGLN